jgi:superfamily II DNA or RNA helicase
MPDLVENIQAEIAARLVQLRPAVEEYEQSPTGAPGETGAESPVDTGDVRAGSTSDTLGSVPHRVGRRQRGAESVRIGSVTGMNVGAQTNQGQLGDADAIAWQGVGSSALDLIAPGSRVIVRALEWQVIEVERQALNTRAIVRCVGRSELVRDRRAAFYSELDDIEPEDPTRTRFRLDDSTGGIETRLVLESLLRRTPLPISDASLSVGGAMLADDLPFQREPFRAAMAQLQPRLLIADGVGLGKTVEVAMLLAELQRRGRARRILAVVPRHILDQVQHELWCRAGIPLVRLDSEGIQRLRQRIPSGHNPFAYFDRVIVSIDTIKNPSKYRHHLEKVRWDAVWIDESHKLMNRGTLNNQLAQVLAPNADALILTSATPHNGKPESFAELVSLLDPTAVADPEQVTAEDIEHLVVRRHKHSPDVQVVLGDQWAERADPVPISIRPTPEEEAIFAELAANWTGPDADPPCDDRLFPWTLLKAALSSPVALAESIENRLRRQDTGKPDSNASTDDREVLLLRHLWALAKDAERTGSAKLDELVRVCRSIGVGPKSATRAVIFSERLSTLDWIACALRDDLAMSEVQVRPFHNRMPDDEQQHIVESFSMASAPIRVMVASDIASEGVNLHKQCHNLIHFDLPWSLITLEQRNGRIDRYGQEYPPEIRYLIYRPEDPEIASDVRIVSRLIGKEHVAHRALGDAASVMGLHSETAEEDKVIDILRKRTEEQRAEALEEAAPEEAVFDPWAFAGLSRTSDGEPPKTVTRGPVVEVSPAQSLFIGDDEYLVNAMGFVFESLHSLNWETDDAVLSFKPPEDLLRRLASLPQSYLRQRKLAERIRLTADHTVADRSLLDAVDRHASKGETGTAWPEVHHLGPQHPVLDWIADKVLYRVGRDEALALSCRVSEPTILVSGVWSNRVGEPLATAWLAATVEDGLPTFADLHETLRAAGAASGMVNPGSSADLGALSEQLPTVVLATQKHLEDEMRRPLMAVNDRLDATRHRLERWQMDARAVASGIRSDPHRTRRLADIEGVSKQITALIADHTPADRPLVRIIGALVPSGAASG